MSEQAFVGRERELARLEGFLARARSGQGQVCFVTGEAGSGKTALVETFARRAQDADEGLALASGNCNAQSGAGDPYLPFRELLGVLIGVTGRAAAEDQPREGRLRHWLVRSTQVLIEVGPELVNTIIPGSVLVARAGRALAQKAGWLDELDKLAGRKPADQAAVQPEHLLEQYANVLRALAAERPLLLVVDDLHWADAASVDLLFHLSRRLDGSAALLVGTYRRGELYRRGTERHPLDRVLAEIKRYAGDVWVELRPGETKGRDFVNRLLDTEPNRLGADFREALFRHTEGHPLFTVELLRSLQERGDLIKDAGGCWVVGPRLDFDTLPSRVEGVIEQRIGHLEEAQQEVLRVASVEGEAFTAEVVAGVQGLAPRPVLRDLSQELEGRHGLVREQGELRAGRRLLSGYRFAHALFQHYLYGGLGRGERRMLHAEVGRVLEELYAESPDPVVLAWHADRAGEDDRAAGFYRQAGEQAIRQGAPQEAVRLLTRGLELIPEADAVRRFEVLLVREKALDLQGQREAQLGDVEELEGLAEILKDDGKRCEAALRRANYAEAVSDFPAAVAAAARAVALAETANHLDYRAEGHLAWGHALQGCGSHEEVRVHLELALQLAEMAGDTRLRATALLDLGVLTQGVNFREAEAFFQQALNLYRQIGDLRGETSALRCLGTMAANLLDYERAGTFLEQGAAMARRLGDRRSEAYANYALGAAASNQGHYAEAEGPLQVALEICQQIGQPMFEAYTLSILGVVRMGQEEFAQARQLLQAALDKCQEIGNPFGSSIVLNYMGELERLLGNYTRARAHLTAALEIAGNAQATIYELETLCVLAEVELDEGNPSQALSLARRSREGEHTRTTEARFVEASALLTLDRLEEAEAAFHEVLRTPEGSQAWVRLNAETGLAEVALARGDLRRALTLVEGILPRLGQSDLLKDVRSAYLVCHEVLRACGDPRAKDVLEQGWRRLERQASTLDEAARERFVNNVPSRRRLAAAWRAAEGRVHVKEREA